MLLAHARKGGRLVSDVFGGGPEAGPDARIERLKQFRVVDFRLAGRRRPEDVDELGPAEEKEERDQEKKN